MADAITSDLSAENKNLWSTPQWLFDALNNEFNFDIDAAANAENTKCDLFIDESLNALSNESWRSLHTFVGDCSVWINPPYSRGMVKLFMEKARQQADDENITTVLLVPATPEAAWWPERAEIRFITNGRISFIHPITNKPVNGNTKGSVVIIMRPGDSELVTNYVSRESLAYKSKLLSEKAA